MKKPDIDLYAILKLSKDTTEEEIDKAYSERAMIFHPDKVPYYFYTVANEIMNELNIAKEWLLDSEKRKLYDSDYNSRKQRGDFRPSALEVYCNEVIVIKKLSEQLTIKEQSKGIEKIIKKYQPIDITIGIDVYA